MVETFTLALRSLPALDAPNFGDEVIKSQEARHAFMLVQARSIADHFPIGSNMVSFHGASFVFIVSLTALTLWCRKHVRRSPHSQGSSWMLLEVSLAQALQRTAPAATRFDATLS